MRKPNHNRLMPDGTCRYNSGSTSVSCGVLRAQAGRIAEENCLRSPGSASMRLSLTRGAGTSIAPAAVRMSQLSRRRRQR